MKIREPFGKKDLKIKRKDRVLEVGPGPFPSSRSNVLVEKFIDSNEHRSSNVRKYPHQELINADGANMPFKNQSFDYIICSHVLEHVEDPQQFVNELARVAQKGYIELPSLVGELLCPKDSHKWVALEIDKKIVMVEKTRLPYTFKPDFGYMFTAYLPFKSLTYAMLKLEHAFVSNIRQEWSEKIEVVVNPEDDYYLSYFTKKWDMDMIRKIVPPTSHSKILWRATKVFFYLLKEKVLNKFESQPQEL